MSAADAAAYYAGDAARRQADIDELTHRLGLMRHQVGELEKHVNLLISEHEDALADLIAMTTDRDYWRDTYEEVAALPDENDLTDDQVQRLLVEAWPVTIELRPHTTAAGVAQVEASPGASLDAAGDDLSPSPATTPDRLITGWLRQADEVIRKFRDNTAHPIDPLIAAAVADYEHRVATGKGYPDALTAAELLKRYKPVVTTTLDTDPTAT